MKGMKRYSPVLVLALLALLAGCGGQAAPEAEAMASPESDVVAEAEPVSAQEPAPDAQARGQAAMREFGDRLRNELRAAMSEDGAAGAVSFCHDQAPRIADEVMAAHGVRLGRVAVAGRNRNPGNAHGGWQGGRTGVRDIATGLKVARAVKAVADKQGGGEAAPEAVAETA